MPHLCLWVESRSALPFAHYALSSLLAPLGMTVRALDSVHHCPPGSPLVTYAAKVPAGVAGPHLHIAASALFGPGFGGAESVPGGPLPWDDDLPVLFTGGKTSDPLVSETPGRIVSRIDILAGTFFLLSGYEEAVLAGKNSEGNLIARHGVAGREGFVDWPAVDVMRERLQAWLRALNLPITRLAPWGSPFALAVTHDVEPHFAAPPLARWRQARKVRAQAPALVKTWLEAEAAAGIQATYCLPVRRRHERLPLGIGALRQAQAILAAGHEVAAGLPPGRAARHPARAVTRLEEGLKRPLRGVRQAGWRWDSLTMNALLQLHGFDYDCSLGFPERPGFRAGTAWPFRLFDLGARRPVDVWEIPVLVTARSWQQGLPAKIESALKRFGGLMVLDWSSADGPTGTYAAALQQLGAQGLRLGSADQLLAEYMGCLPSAALDET